MSKLRSRVARLEAKVQPRAQFQGMEFVCRLPDESDAEFHARTGYASDDPDDVEITVTMKFDTELNPPEC